MSTPKSTHTNHGGNEEKPEWALTHVLYLWNNIESVVRGNEEKPEWALTLFQKALHHSEC